ncbi:MAG: transcription termination factor NusA [Candidatus Saccharimonadales bacterium]
MDTKQFIMTMKQIAEEKNLPYEVVEDALQQAIAAAYRKDYGEREQNVRAELNAKTGEFTIFIVYDVVDEVEDEYTQLDLKSAQQKDKMAEVGGVVEEQVSYDGFGRVAAQTAKQVILQKLREAERDVVFAEYQDKVGTILNGTVQRVEPRVVYIDVGKAQGILPQSEQIQGEHYRATQRLKVYLREVESSPRGPQLILSRATPDFVALLFAREVPEMESGAVEIRAIAREAGVRTKLAVASTVPNVDPVGTFVGGHGTRVQAVMNEVGEEKIDIIMFAEDTATFITNALAPTQIKNVKLDEAEQRAIVEVAEDQLSIAIGRAGQNVRLASKLTGWQIDIISEGGELRTQSKPAEPIVKPELDATAATKKPAKSVPEKTPERKKKYVTKAQLEASLLESLSNGSDASEEE